MVLSGNIFEQLLNFQEPRKAKVAKLLGFQMDDLKDWPNADEHTGAHLRKQRSEYIRLLK